MSRACPGANERARLGATARVSAHRALDRKSGNRARGGTEQKVLILDCHNEAENNGVTAAQIAAQIPSDRSTVTIKYAGASGR
jgi:hypothetical protein